jgi:hypothetical protein
LPFNSNKPETPMKPQSRAFTCLAVSAVALLTAIAAASAQRSGAGPCRQGLLALMVMIDAEEQDKTLYRSTAKEVVDTCGPAAKTSAAAPAPKFDRDQCGKLAVTMLDTIEDGKLDTPQFAQVRDAFAGQCIGG